MSLAIVDEVRPEPNGALLVPHAFSTFNSTTLLARDEFNMSSYTEEWMGSVAHYLSAVAVSANSLTISHHIMEDEANTTAGGVMQRFARWIPYSAYSFRTSCDHPEGSATARYECDFIYQTTFATAG